MHRVRKLVQHASLTTSDIIAVGHTTSFSYLSQQYPVLFNALKQIFNDRYCEELKVLRSHGKKRTGKVIPNAVIYPKSTQEVVTLVKLCNNHKPPIPIIPFTAGTSIEAQILPQSSANCTISIDFSKHLNKLIAVYPQDMQCVVQPGINWYKLNKILSKHNLFLATDPSPRAGIGGMIATCCSGPSAVKYGTMRHQVINLTIVLSNGTIIKTGQRAIKSVAGYDLNGLFVGSEGTLGIIVQATLRLRTLYKYNEIGQAIFDTMDMRQIGDCVKEINQTGVELAAFEYMDDKMIQDFNKYDPTVNIPNGQLIIFKFQGPTQKHIDADIKLIRNIVMKYSKYPLRWSKNEKERKRLWSVRKVSFLASRVIYKGLTSISTDVAVPFSKFGECLLKCKKEIDESILHCVILGHIGDGNFHVGIFYDPNIKKQVLEMKRLNYFIVDLALKLNGTCTAEHGVGKRKKKFLEKELGTNTVQFMKKLKRYIDPNCILSPGNIVDVS